MNVDIKIQHDSLNSWRVDMPFKCMQKQINMSDISSDIKAFVLKM